MSTPEILSFVSIGVSVLLGLLVFVTNRRANRNNERKTTIEEQATIADQRLEELNRLYPRVESLETTVESLKEKIGELEKDRDFYGQLVSSLRHLILSFAQRVERAWDAMIGRAGDLGVDRPTLTPEELELLERTEPLHRRYATKTR